jgi:TRAP-type mannitol/chloroaromatic compound transport system substrate-binding protein
MNRRHLFGAAAALLVTLGLAGCNDETAPAAQQAAAAPAQTFQWKMVTSWPKNYPGLGTAAERLAERINAMSNGRLSVKVYAAGELVPALEVFDAVSRGTAEMGHGTPYYWKGKVPAAQFFSSIPFGFSTAEMNAWIHKGDGQALWDEAYGAHGVKPFSAGNTTMQMGGWFNKEINSIDDLKGLKIRMPGLGGEVLAKLGATTINLPGGEIFTSLQTGAIDATDWVNPYNDLAFGLNKAAKYYYFPAWQEPQALVELLVNKTAYEKLPADLQAIVSEAARAATLDMMDDYTFNNAKALPVLLEQGTQLKRFPDEVLNALREESVRVIADVAAESELTTRILESQKAFLSKTQPMAEISDKELYNWR